MDNMQPTQPADMPTDDTVPKTDVKVEVEYSEKISRLFIFRFLWAYIMMWPLMFWAIWLCILNFFHFWYMLFLGKRHKALWQSNVRYYRHLAKWYYYFGKLTDKRPQFIED